MQNACSSFKNPRTFVSERIDDDGCEMKGCEPFTQRAGVASERLEHGVE